MMREIGTVIHYYGKLSVAVVKLHEPLAVQEQVTFRGATTEFEQGIDSIQVDHQNIEMAGKGQEVAIKVKNKVRVGDRLYKAEEDY